jgi:hypothetical protein
MALPSEVLACHRHSGARFRDEVGDAQRILVLGSASGLDLEVELETTTASDFIRESDKFEAGSFDALWCNDPPGFGLPEVLSGAFRVLRPAGQIRMVGLDLVHQVLLPWSPNVELAVRTAELRALQDGPTDHLAYYSTRQLHAALRAAGFAGVRVEVASSTSSAPLDAAERARLQNYFSSLAARVRRYLDPLTGARFDRLLDEGSSSYLLDSSDFYVTYVDHLACATKSQASADQAAE